MLCGGWFTDGKSMSNDCFDLRHSEPLEPVTTMKYTRRGAAAVVIGESLFVTGGYIGKMSPSGGPQKMLGITTYTEFVTPGLVSRVGPKIPKRVAHHCLAKIDENKVIIVGGYVDVTSRYTIMFKHPKLHNFKTKAWSSGPALYRDHLGCGVIEAQEGMYCMYCLCMFVYVCVCIVCIVCVCLCIFVYVCVCLYMFVYVCVFYQYRCIALHPFPRERAPKVRVRTTTILYENHFLARTRSTLVNVDIYFLVYYRRRQDSGSSWRRRQDKETI